VPGVFRRRKPSVASARNSPRAQIAKLSRFKLVPFLGHTLGISTFFVNARPIFL
jgi:hypothetical protein